FQDHHELRPLNLSCHFPCVRNLKRPFLQPLVVDHKAAPVPHQELDHVPPPVQKHKDTTAQQIPFHFACHQSAESVKTLSDIRHPGIQKIPSFLIKTDHPTNSFRYRTSTGPLKRTTVPFAYLISVCPSNPYGRTCTKPPESSLCCVRCFFSQYANVDLL